MPYILGYNLYKKQRLSNFNQKYKPGEFLYFKQFVQARTKDYRQVIKEKAEKETCLLLRGFSGRNLGQIAEDSNEEEVVFLPFTYFTIDEIIVNDKQNPSVEYIFLTEMQTPYNYSNPFLLWVDDQPHNISNKLI